MARRTAAAACGLPVVLENDANAAVLGECWLGAGRECEDVVMLTLGTGIGGGIVLGGRLWRGRYDNAGELGHMIIVAEGEPCACGQRGCLEAYASAKSTAARAERRLRAGERSTLTASAITAVDVVEHARAGDGLARQVWDETCRGLAVACVNLQHALNPQRIILAGGMSAAGRELIDPVRRHFERLTWPDIGDRPEIVPSELGNDAGVLGAARSAMLTHA
jgi:glucokinase